MKCPRRAEDGANYPSVFNLPKDDEWRGGCCSYCGSITPEALFEAIERGEKIGPTDKSYKIYVGDAGRKFYFQHLSQSQRNEFIRLYNERKMNMGYPGHFYVTPFFCQKVKDATKPEERSDSSV